MEREVHTPFPTDDVETNTLALNQYLRNYYRSIRDVYNPVVIKASQGISKWPHANGCYEFTKELSPRFYDLMKLQWTSLDSSMGSEKLDSPATFTQEDYR